MPAVAEVLVEGDKVQGVRMASGEVVRCPRVVSNAGVQNTFGQLLQGTTPGVQAAKALLPTVQGTYAIVGLNIGFKASHAELGFTPANIWMNCSGTCPPRRSAWMWWRCPHR